MKYSKAYLSAIGYRLAPVVVTSEELEERLEPAYRRLHLQSGQLEALTGIRERRWWEPNPSLSGPCAEAAERALSAAGVAASEVEAVIYAGVCRENFEPATACAVAARLGVHPDAAIFDISNACLGVINGILELANRIELGQIRAGLVVSAETAREIVEVTIDHLNREATLENFTPSLATLTGGSGAVAVLVTDGSFSSGSQPAGGRLRAGVHCAAPEHHELCRWGLAGSSTLHALDPRGQRMDTDSIGVLQHGVELGVRTWEKLLAEVEWSTADVDRVICHQVGGPHRDTILGRIGVDPSRDFSTFPYLGNIGTVSLPITAAIAHERGFLGAGQRVAFLGIGSGLNCLMLGVEWST